MQQCEKCPRKWVVKLSAKGRTAYGCEEHKNDISMDITGRPYEETMYYIEKWRDEIEEWKQSYDDMDFIQQREKYEGYHDEMSYQDQFRANWWLTTFNKLPKAKLSVIEVGGYLGKLATLILRYYSNIEKWHNYDIQRNIVKDKVCIDSRYEAVVLEDYIWNNPPDNDYNVFVASHLIEHLNEEDLEKLIDTIMIKCDFILLEAPLEKNTTDADWSSSTDPHFLEIGWKQVTDILTSKGYSVLTSDNKWNYMFTKLRSQLEYDPNKSRIENHNRWRKNYELMTYQDHKNYYQAVFNEAPHQRQYTYDEVSYPFERLKDKNLWVIEFGGYQGELAHQILRKYDNIKLWDNYEITDRALKYRICNDERYHPIVLDGFIWDYASGTHGIPGVYNLFISSHTIEHITGHDFQKLVDKVIRHVDYCILEIPLPMDMSKGVETWNNYDGTHIQDLSYTKIVNILFEAGFTNFQRTGENSWNYFGWKELKNPYAKD
jgi:hypothetical protein